MSLKKLESCSNTSSLSVGEVDSSESVWALTKKILTVSIPSRSFLRSGKRRGRREKESLGAIDGDASRIGDLVGFLTLDLWFLVRGDGEESAARSSQSFTRADEEVLRSRTS